jgi:hypothetical protein
MLHYTINFVNTDKPVTVGMLAKAEVAEYEGQKGQNAAIFLSEDDAQTAAGDFEYYYVEHKAEPPDIVIRQYNGETLVKTLEVD